MEKLDWRAKIKSSVSKNRSLFLILGTIFSITSWETALNPHEASVVLRLKNIFKIRL